MFCTIKFVYYKSFCVRDDIKLLSELEKKAGLIERKRQGLGKPNLIYVKNFISAVDSQLLNCENHNSGTMEITTQELPKSQCNNTDIKNTEFSDTDSIFPSGKGGMIDENDRYQEYFDYFSDQLSMDLLKKDYPYDSEMLDNILELIVETVCTKRPLIRIGAEERPAEIVRSRFMKLNAEHIRYVMDCFKENTTKIRNIRQYMLTTIYNAPTTIDTYIHGFEADIKTVEAHPQIAEGFCGMEIRGKAYTEKADAGEILLAACKDTKSADPVPLGSYRGFQMELSFDSFRNEFDVTLKGAVSHRVALGTDARGNITRLDNALAGIPERLERANEQLNNLYNQQEAAKAEVGKPFPQEAELTAKSQRLAELDAALNMEDSAEKRDERSESERPSVLADLKSKAEHIPPAKYSEPREEVL